MKIIQFMTTVNDSNKMPPAESFGLQYEQVDSQGECILISITPVYRSLPMFILYIFLCIIFVGLPLLITWWYPWLKRVIYFRACSLQEAQFFHVVNYDDVSTYPQKKQTEFYFSSRESRETIYFENRYMIYVVENETVKGAEYDFIARVQQVLNHQSPQKKSYLSERDVPNLTRSHGPGVMVIQMPSIPMLFFLEVMRPLYMFILFSCSLWIYQQYYYYSGIIFVTAAIGIITNLVQTYQNNKKIFEMAYNQQQINTLRGGEVEKISSTLLVPGDIVFLKEQIKIPFDGIILEGEALINQCALTGQSVPILKKPEKIQKKSDIKSSYIYEGTSLIQVGNKKKMVKFEHYREKYGVPVIVSKTNFKTMKGQLIRVITFPKERQNVFERQSTYFLLFLFCLSIASYGILISKLKDEAGPLTLFVKFLDLITITVPPGLPVSMTFGIIFALEKMKDKKIFCSSPNKVVYGGLINCLCFDKTGTLTEDFMDFNCLLLYDNGKFSQPIQNHNLKDQRKGNELIQLIKTKPKMGVALNNMAMNHTLAKVQINNEVVGDPMELKLFEFGQFQFTNDQANNSEVIMSFTSSRGHKGDVYKRFDFDSQLFRMSAVGMSSTSSNLHIYVKGSPEMMIDIFKKDTIPSNYNQVLKEYASQGFRVLAIGSRQIQKGNLNNDRSQLERQITFDGFEVFQNRLKPQTKGAINQFIQSQLPCIMITGDNALTGSNMAYQCGISDPDKITLICNYDPKTNNFSIQQFVYKTKGADEFKDVKKRKKVLSQEQFFVGERKQIKNSFQLSERIKEQINGTNSSKDRQSILKRLKDLNVQLCITGTALNRIFQSQQLTQQEQYILERTTVFARAKPNDKIKAISLYQKIGKKVSMCGDGANDCGALKQADIGLSLSMAEASIAAPFTSQITNINSMVELLKQCRAGLATNFSLFNIMALYSLVQYTTTIITQYYFSYPWDLQYLYWDIFCNFLFFLTIGYTKTADKLSVQIPNGSLFTVSNMIEVVLIFGLQLVGQILMMVGLTQIFGSDMGYTSTTTYDKFVENERAFILESHENCALFLFSNIMYIMTLLAFSISKPWRKDFYTNPAFMVVLVIMLGYSLVMIPVKQARLGILKLDLLDYQPLNWYIFGLAIGFGIVIYIVQKFILENIFNHLKLKYPKAQWL